jgi:hypothetical protein
LDKSRQEKAYSRVGYIHSLQDAMDLFQRQDAADIFQLRIENEVENYIWAFVKWEIGGWPNLVVEIQDDKDAS